MRKKVCFTVDTDNKQDQAMLSVIEQIPQCLRGSFIKITIMMGMDPEKDADIFNKYPDFLHNPMRFEIIKALLRAEKQQANNDDLVLDNRSSAEKQQWPRAMSEIQLT